MIRLFSAFILASALSAFGAPVVRTALNTGPTAAHGTALSGVITVTTDGALYENFTLNGKFDIRANNVTIRNGVINATGYDRAIDGTNTSGKSGILVQEVSITGAEAAGVQCEGISLVRNTIVGNEDGIKAESNMLIHDNYIADCGLGPSSHGDGIQISNGSNITIIGNTFVMPPGVGGYTNDICIFLKEDFGPISNVTIDSNYIDGGGWSINIGPAGSDTPDTLVVTNNKFGDNASKGGTAAYGAWSNDGATNVTFACNSYWFTAGNHPDNSANSGCSVVWTDSGGSDVTGPVISSVSVSVTGQTTATITWTTDEASTSTVNYGTTASYGSTATGSSGVTSHSVNLTGLGSATTYHYRVRSTDAASNETVDSDATFATLSAPTPAPVSVHIIRMSSMGKRNH
jgi:hypothetical protein